MITVSVVAVNLLAAVFTLAPVALAGGAPTAGSAPMPTSGRLTLEEELNSIVRQHDNAEGNDKKLAEALISKILVDGLEGAAPEPQLVVVPAGDPSGESVDGDALAAGAPTDGRLRQWLGGLDGADLYSPFTSLPNGPVGTIKRAAKMAAKSHQRNYGRQSYDFGLGKRPDSSGSLLARFGEQASSSLVQPVGQFGKRPSAHRYDFGLGKRVASPAYPRYDFGLGKRAPSYVRQYDFGLGK